MGLQDLYRLLKLPGSTHLLRDQLGRDTEFSAPRAARGREGQSPCSGSCPVADLTSAPSASCRGLCTERPPLKALLPNLRAFQATCSGRAVTPSAHRDPAGRTFLPLRPGLRAALGWSLNWSVHLLPSQSTDSSHYLNRYTNLQNFSQLLRSIKAAFANEELPKDQFYLHFP